MSDSPRKHHYVPQFFLAGFTPSGRRKDFLWVTDKKKLEQRKARPLKVALKRDFYGVEGEGVDPQQVEQGLDNPTSPI